MLFQIERVCVCVRVGALWILIVLLGTCGGYGGCGSQGVFIRSRRQPISNEHRCVLAFLSFMQ